MILGFSEYWYTAGTSLVVFLPYFTVTVNRWDGTFCPRYFPVLQVICVPNDRLERREETLKHPAGERKETHPAVKKKNDLHFAGNTPHRDGDVVFRGRVQVFSFDGDHGSPGCRTLRWFDCGWFGVLDGEEE